MTVSKSEHSHDGHESEMDCNVPGIRRRDSLDEIRHAMTGEGDDSILSALQTGRQLQRQQRRETNIGMVALANADKIRRSRLQDSKSYSLSRLNSRAPLTSVTMSPIASYGRPAKSAWGIEDPSSIQENLRRSSKLLKPEGLNVSSISFQKGDSAQDLSDRKGGESSGRDIMSPDTECKSPIQWPSSKSNTPINGSAKHIMDPEATPMNMAKTPSKNPMWVSIQNLDDNDSSPKREADQDHAPRDSTSKTKSDGSETKYEV